MDNKNLDEYYDAFPLLFMYKGAYAVSYGMKKTTIEESGKVVEHVMAYTPFSDGDISLVMQYKHSSF